MSWEEEDLSDSVGGIDDWAEVECPYCGERLAIYLEPETRGGLVQDCEVCCRPWQLWVERDRDGRLSVRADPDF